MDILFFTILTIGIPIVGMIINFIATQDILNTAIDNLSPKGINWEEKITKIRTKINILRIMPTTGLIFSILIFQIYLMSEYELSKAIEEKILLSVGFAMGLTAFFMCIGMTIFFREAIPGIVEDQRTYGKYLVISSIPMTTVIYALLISILLFMGVGLLGDTPEVEIDEDQASDIFNSFLIFSILSSSTVLKGYLPTIVKGDIKPIDESVYKKRAQKKIFDFEQPDIPPDPVFSKKMIFSTIAETPIFIGLLIVIITFVEIGIL